MRLEASARNRSTHAALATQGPVVVAFPAAVRMTTAQRSPLASVCRPHAAAVTTTARRNVPASACHPSVVSVMTTVPRNGRVFAGRAYTQTTTSAHRQSPSVHRIPHMPTSSSLRLAERCGFLRGNKGRTFPRRTIPASRNYRMSILAGLAHRQSCRKTRAAPNDVSP